MPGLVPGIHVFVADLKGVDGRDKPGHDGKVMVQSTIAAHQMTESACDEHSKARPGTRAGLSSNLA